MKIAIIAHCLYPIAEPFEGGLEMITYLLCRSLMAKGHEVDLYAHPDSDTIFNVVPIRTDRTIPSSLSTDMAQFGFRDRPLQELLGYTDVMTAISINDYDIVHNHSLHYIPILMGNQERVPFITTLHTPPFPFLRLGAFGILDRSCQKFTMVSKSLADTWREFIPESQVVHNGIDIGKWTFNSETTEDYLFWYGRVCPEKGTDLAIRAAIKSGSRIVLAGPNCNEGYFDEIVRPLLQNPNVSYVGHRTQDQIIPLLSNAKATLFTSTWEEPFGLTLTESLACGTPVLAFEGGATREILTSDTGVIVAKNDVAALARAVGRIATLSRNACRQRALKFSHEVMVECYLGLYYRMVGRSGPKILEAI